MSWINPEITLDTKKWGKLRIGAFGWGLFLWSLIFGIIMLWFGNGIFVILCLLTMFIAGQFVNIYKNWNEFHKGE